MSARSTILNIAKENEIKATDLAKAMGYEHVNSLYRALGSPGQISFKRIKALSKKLSVDVCEICRILK